MLGERIVLTGAVFIVALQRVAQTIPDGIIRRHLRQFFEFVHDGIHHILERFFEIGILFFTAGRAQFQRKLQQLFLDGCRWFGDGFHAINKLMHNCPCRFGHVLISCILPNIEIFQLCPKDAVCHRRAQFYNSIPFQNCLLICPNHHVNVWVRICVVVSRIPMQCRRWNMKRFRKLILLADEQLPPSCGIVITKPLRVLTMQGIDDCPDVAIARC